MTPPIKVFVVTGGTSGIGKETARYLAQRCPDAKILLTGRSKEKCDAAIASIVETCKKDSSAKDSSTDADKKDSSAVTTSHTVDASQFEGRPLELTDFASIRALVAEIQSMVVGGQWQVMAVLDNAGLQVNSRQLTESGLERTFHANHLGTFYLTSLLVPVLQAHPLPGGEPCRIVIVSSNSHRSGRMYSPIFQDPQEIAYPPDDSNFVGFRAYTSSKLCNLLFAYELNRRLMKQQQDTPSNGGGDGSGSGSGNGSGGSGASKRRRTITVNAYSPGWIPETGLARDGNFLLRFAMSQVFPRFIGRFPGGSTLPRACQFLSRLLADKEFQHWTGKYVYIDQQGESSESSHDEARQLRLWQYSEELVAKLAAH